MEPNKRALIILQMLVLTAVVIFLVERKFLVTESRGATLSNYEDVSGMDRVLLLVEDFEGLSRPDSVVLGDSLLKMNGFFSFGSAGISLDHARVDKNPLASKTALKVQWTATEGYGGWGRGVGANVELDAETDYLNFRCYNPKSNGNDEVLKVILEEDDNDNGKLEKEIDDVWATTAIIPAKDEWQIVSLPLKDFTDDNPGGDHILNVTRKGGLHNVIFVFGQPDKYTREHSWYFDFVCFSNEKMIDNMNLK
jgi:hypothetical protein